MALQITASRYRPEINYLSLDCKGIPFMDINGNIIDYYPVYNDTILPFARRSYDGIFEYPTHQDAIEFNIPASAPSIYSPGYLEEYRAKYWVDSRVWELIDTPKYGLVYAVKFVKQS